MPLLVVHCKYFSLQQMNFSTVVPNRVKPLTTCTYVMITTTINLCQKQETLFFWNGGEVGIYLVEYQIIQLMSPWGRDMTGDTQFIFLWGWQGSVFL